MTERDYAELLRKEGASPSAVFHEFRLRYAPESNDLHVFVEGHDDVLFYKPFFSNVRREFGTYFYESGGKAEVREIRHMVLVGGYRLSSCRYIIDRDWDDLYGTQVEIDDQTFVTDFYSVENYIVSQESADILLGDFARVPRALPDYSKSLSKVESCVQEFAKAMRPFIGVILYAKISLGARPNVNNINLSKVFEISPDGKVQKKKDGYKHFAKACSIPKFNPVLARVMIRKLEIDLAKLWLRGRFELWCFRQVLIAVIEALKPTLSVRIVCPEAVKQNRFFEILGGRLHPSPALKDFIDQCSLSDGARSTPSPV